MPKCDKPGCGREMVNLNEGEQDHIYDASIPGIRFAPMKPDWECPLSDDQHRIAELEAQLAAVRKELEEAVKKVEELGPAYGVALLALAEAKRAIPTSWLDPLLTGPKAVIGKPPYTCADVEKLLKAISKRIEENGAVSALESARAKGQDGEG